MSEHSFSCRFPTHGSPSLRYPEQCRDSQGTALFCGRRVKVHFVDLQQRAASAGELQRFAQKCGVPALLDRSSRRFTALGLGAARLSDDRWLEKLVEELLLLRMPLVRHRQALTIGDVEIAWRE